MASLQAILMTSRAGEVVRPRLLGPIALYEQQETIMSAHAAPASVPQGWTSSQAVEAAARAARARRVSSGEIMTYVVDGWVVREYPGHRIERLAPLAEFRDEDFPYPA
ncbi:hypothetical protein EBE87_24070 [Pseudoroseomonas wenyumeiae]|uniref:Uncharacterized protein n=1 Tax=Teichococcus wenyumeiae TaxID=2478470 RepID=A0ABX9VEH6_9PROT|nr:hypothetical protein EBE87_24070 [Pseudoroseomonas wenyumeiae]